MDYITVILSGSSCGLVLLAIATYIFRGCKRSECNAHLEDNVGNHFDISVGTPMPEHQPTHSSTHTAPIEEQKGPEIV